MKGKNNMKVIIFGAGDIGRRYYGDVKSGGVNVVAFADSNSHKFGDSIDNVPIIPPENIQEYDYDSLIVLVERDEHFAEIISKLRELNIDDDRVDITTRLSYVGCFQERSESDPRVKWLNEFAKYVHENQIRGNVCECGVFRGGFAAYINKYFYDRKLYLFDTFEGFSKESIDKELSRGDKRFEDGGFWKTSDIYRNTNTIIVMNKMQYPKNCIIKQGLFPQSAVGVSDSFCFVNLDMDLYAPMLDALHFFWDKMTNGGVILLHDYFQPTLPGVAKAVADFENVLQCSLPKTPIGDSSSIAIIKT